MNRNAVGAKEMVLHLAAQFNSSRHFWSEKLWGERIRFPLQWNYWFIGTDLHFDDYGQLIEYTLPIEMV